NRRLAFWVRFIVVTLQLTGSLVAVMLVNGAEQLTEEALAEIDPGELLYYVSTSLILSFGYYLSACYFCGQSSHRSKQRWKLQQAHDNLAHANQKDPAAAVHVKRIHIVCELYDILDHLMTVMGFHASAARQLL